ncbi:MAG: PD40 domain-containing protein [Theionarchaea archaeon]|nr:PD40 domain-containing protein [Theionarchaea archaeon]
MQTKLILYSAGVLVLLSFFTFSQDSQKIAFTSDRDGNWEIYTMYTDGTHQTNVTRNRHDDSDPVWSPDGRKIAFVSDRDREKGIFVMDADGSSLTNLTGMYNYCWKPAWSPDGERIAFVSLRGGSFDIFVMDIDGSNVIQLTNDRAWDSNPSWSPDGQKIAFTSNKEKRWEIYIMNADGSNVQRLLSTSAYDSEPEWSPDGEKIVFYSRRDYTPDIYVIHADGTNLQRLTNDPAWDSDPSWSPDGRKIVFYSDRDGDPDIYVMNADGSSIERLTNDKDDNWYPQWSPTIRDSAIITGFFSVSLLVLWLLVRYVRYSLIGLGIFLVILCGPTFSPVYMQLDYDEYTCPLCRHNLEKAESLHEEVVHLAEEAREHGGLTPEMEATLLETDESLRKARLFCYKSKNCIAGNNLAQKYYNILKEVKETLHYSIEERKEEYAVYSALIRVLYQDGFGMIGGDYNLQPVEVYVIKENTSVYRSGRKEMKETLQWVCENMSETVGQDILDDFETKNAQSYSLGDFFDLPARVMFIGDTERMKIFWKGFFWLEFYAKYPFAQGVMTVSRVGFDVEMKKAFVYLGNMEGGTAGAGCFFLLIKEDGVWTVRDEVVLWVS